jgi:hypothetical protein
LRKSYEKLTTVINEVRENKATAEENGSDNDDNDSHNNPEEYSEDFETSYLNNSILSQKRGSSSPKKTASINTFKTLPKVSEEEPVIAKNAPSVRNDKQNEFNDILELLRRESVVASKPQASVPNDPFVDSVAKSFLASQVCYSFFLSFVSSFCCWVSRSYFVQNWILYGFVYNQHL